MFADRKTEAICGSPTCFKIVNCRTNFLRYFEAYLEFLRYCKMFIYSTISRGKAIGSTSLFWCEKCVLESAFLAVSSQTQGCLCLSLLQTPALHWFWRMWVLTLRVCPNTATPGWWCGTGQGPRARAPVAGRCPMWGGRDSGFHVPPPTKVVLRSRRPPWSAAD